MASTCPAQPVNPFRSGLSRLGLFDFHNLETVMIRAIGDITFEELAKPLAIGASDLITGQRVTITDGRVALAVHASSAVPGVVIPVRWRGSLLCDGVVSGNIPIRELREMGADVVLAVNIMSRHRKMPSSFLWAGSNAFTQLVIRAGDCLKSADLLIEPDLAETDYLFPDGQELIALGWAATEPIITQLQALLAT